MEAMHFHQTKMQALAIFLPCPYKETWKTDKKRTFSNNKRIFENLINQSTNSGKEGWDQSSGKVTSWRGKLCIFDLWSLSSHLAVSSCIFAVTLLWFLAWYFMVWYLIFDFLIPDTCILPYCEAWPDIFHSWEHPLETGSSPSNVSDVIVCRLWFMICTDSRFNHVF